VLLYFGARKCVLLIYVCIFVLFRTSQQVLISLQICLVIAKLQFRLVQVDSRYHLEELTCLILQRVLLNSNRS